LSSRQYGFTLIELVMTVVLLGVLAVTALPRFADLSDEADQAVFEAVRANFKIGVNLVHSVTLVKRKNLSSFPDISLEGQCIQVDSATGYPLVDQTSGTCTPVAMLDDYNYQILPPSKFDQSVEQLLAFMATPMLIAPAYAAPAPPAPPPPGIAELPSLLMDNEFEGWVWDKATSTATLIAPNSAFLSYNQTTGAVN